MEHKNIEIDFNFYVTDGDEDTIEENEDDIIFYCEEAAYKYVCDNYLEYNSYNRYMEAKTHNTYWNGYNDLVVPVTVSFNVEEYAEYEEIDYDTAYKKIMELLNGIAGDRISISDEGIYTKYDIYVDEVVDISL